MTLLQNSEKNTLFISKVSFILSKENRLVVRPQQGHLRRTAWSKGLLDSECARECGDLSTSAATSAKSKPKYGLNWSKTVITDVHSLYIHCMYLSIFGYYF